MKTPAASIIMRSYNEGWALAETLAMVQAQDFTDWELIVIDSGSTDGSQELIRAAAPVHFVQITPAEYNPSRVMNHGMRLARAGLGIFLNADATPTGPSWLAPLIEALRSDPKTAAVYGRQLPRPECRAVFARDYERCFGPGPEGPDWEHFFSMVSSGLRKDVWAQRGFREDLQYAEDDEYTRWCKAAGYKVRYVPESVVVHSHNYTPAQSYKRAFGDARAIGQAWQGSPSAFNWPKTVAVGLLRDALQDLNHCLRRRCLRELPFALQTRWQQRRGKWHGFQEGWRMQQAAQPSPTLP